MKRKGFFWLLLLVLPNLMGCKFLVAQDLSGTVALYPSNQGFAFKTVSEIDYEKSYFGDRDRNDFHRASLGKFRDLLAQTGNFELNGEKYELLVDSRQNNYRAEIFQRRGREVATNFVQHHEYGASWGEQIDCSEPEWTRKSISRDADTTVSFVEKITQQTCLVKSSYKITYTIIRKEAEDALELDEMEVVRSEVSVKGSVKIGYQHCLLGERMLDKKLKLKVYVVDANFDGQFDEKDLIKIEQVEKLIPFNTSVSVVEQSSAFLAGKARDYRYIVNLIPPPAKDEPYTLNVKRIQ